MNQEHHRESLREHLQGTGHNLHNRAPSNILHIKAHNTNLHSRAPKPNLQVEGPLNKSTKLHLKLKCAKD